MAGERLFGSQAHREDQSVESTTDSILPACGERSTLTPPLSEAPCLTSRHRLRDRIDGSRDSVRAPCRLSHGDSALPDDNFRPDKSTFKIKQRRRYSHGR